MTLAGLEAKQSSGAELDGLTAGRHLYRPVDDRDPRVLLHLVLAQRLPGVEGDEHRSSALVLVHDVRVERASGSVDRTEVPVLHSPNLLRTTLDRWLQNFKHRGERTTFCRATISGGMSSA